MDWLNQQSIITVISLLNRYFHFNHFFTNLWKRYNLILLCYELWHSHCEEFILITLHNSLYKHLLTYLHDDWYKRSAVCATNVNSKTSFPGNSYLAIGRQWIHCCIYTTKYMNFLLDKLSLSIIMIGRNTWVGKVAKCDEYI